MLFDANMGISWNLHLRRGLRDRELVELEGLIEVLERCRPCSVLEDRWDWKPDSSGVSFSRSFFRALIDEPSHFSFNFVSLIWNAPVPS